MIKTFNSGVKMRITLKYSIFKNFKGFTGRIDFDPVKTQFIGQNGAGKTRLFDGHLWLVTGKNSLGSADFDIKTIKNGVPVSKMEHSMINCYDVDGTELILERIWKEKWTKTRGKAEKELTGHESNFSIDGNANTTKREFETKINEVFGDHLRLVSDPTYLPSLKMIERREKLFAISEDVDLNEIIDSISGLRKALDKKTIDEKKAIADQRKRKINKELDKLPDLIKEHKEIISKASDGSFAIEDAEDKICKKTQAVKDAKKKIDSFESVNNSDNVEELKTLNTDLRIKTTAFENEKNEAQSTWNKSKLRYKNIFAEIKLANESIKSNDSALKTFASSFKSEKETVFSTDSNSCKFCGVEIACGSCDEVDTKGVEGFNLAKSKKLKSINESGKKLNSENKVLKESIDTLEKEKAEVIKVEEPAILSLTQNVEIATLQSKIKKIDDSTEETEVPQDFHDQLKNCEEELKEAQEALAGINATKSSQDRVKELEDKQINFTSEFERIEAFLFMYDEYNKKFAEAAEANVNDLFEYVNFRMFKVQINGAIEPRCDIMNDELKPYETAMSNGERVRSGLDIIKTFSKHYDLYYPVFIDNSESVTEIPKLESQTIELIHSRKKEHKKMVQI